MRFKHGHLSSNSINSRLNFPTLTMFILIKLQIISNKGHEKKTRKQYLLFPPPIFNSLLHHRRPNHHNQRQNRAHRGIRRQRGEGEAPGDEEINVGNPPELLKQRFGNKGDQCVLGCGHIIACIVEIAGLKTFRLIGEGDSGEPRAADIRMIIMKRGLRTRKAEQFTKMEPLPPSPSHLMCSNQCQHAISNDESFRERDRS